MKTKEILQKLKDDVINSLSSKDKVLESDINIKIYENSSTVQYTLEEFFSHYNPEDIGKGQCNLMFRIDLQKITIASFQLKDMYNCSGIIVGSDLFISKSFRNIGLGNILTKFMEDFSRYYGYGILQGADKADNEYQIKIFEKLGWTKSLDFTNRKTGNKLVIYLLNLN